MHPLIRVDVLLIVYHDDSDYCMINILRPVISVLNALLSIHYDETGVPPRDRRSLRLRTEWPMPLDAGQSITCPLAINLLIASRY